MAVADGREMRGTAGDEFDEVALEVGAEVEYELEWVWP